MLWSARQDGGGWRGWCGRRCQAFNGPLCQIGDDKHFDALSCCSERGDERTLRQDVSVREVNLCRDGVANITASFIDTDCSDTCKSGPINSPAGVGVTGAGEGAAESRNDSKCLLDLLTSAGMGRAPETLLSVSQPEIMLTLRTRLLQRL